VETPDVLLELVRLGVGEVQGFLLHRPEPLEGLLAAAQETVSVF
jgi:EAL domain-containing protein (putative c-di-GMP-specific phosphodiesterase class I)